MEFWGVEVKPGQALKCIPGDEKVIHLSQASLGEIKKDKGTENIPIFVNINGQRLVLGTLSSEKCFQIPFDIVLEKEFELSHGSKNTSVFFVGYKSISHAFDSDDDFYDSDSEDDDLDIDEKLVGKLQKTELGKSASEKVVTAKDSRLTLKGKTQKANAEQVKAGKKVENKDNVNDQDDEDEGDDSDDEDMVETSGDSDEEDENDSSEEETPPKNSETAKKRKIDSTSKASVPDKKAKVITPAGIVRTGGDGKKAVHTATPHPAKQVGKQRQTPKSGGSVTCKSCSRTFNSDNALQAHAKAKHGAAAK